MLKSDNIKGALWILIAAGLFSVMLALIKDIGQDLPLTQTLAIRQGFMLLMALPVILSGLPGSIRTAAPHLQITRICTALVAMLAGFTAVQHLPLADATIIAFARNFFVTILAILFLKEVIGVHRWLATLIGFLGVMIMIGTTGSEATTYYGGLAVLGSAAAGLTMILIRKLSQIDQTITIMTYHVVAIGLILAVPAAIYWVQPTTEQWIKLAVLGLITILGQAANIRAYKFGEVTFIAPFDYTRLIYATIIGIIVFNDWPTSQTMIGAAIIIAAALYTIYRENKLKIARVRSPDHPSENG